MKKVLIISDDNQLLAGLKNALFSHGFIIHVLPGREETVNEPAAIKPDLVLIDFLLNNANGGSLSRQLRLHPELSHLPIVLLSSYPDIERFTAKFACNAVISKPITPGELTGTLAVMLGLPELAPNFLYAAS